MDASPHVPVVDRDAIVDGHGDLGLSNGRRLGHYPFLADFDIDEVWVVDWVLGHRGTALHFERLIPVWFLLAETVLDWDLGLA